MCSTQGDSSLDSIPATEPVTAAERIVSVDTLRGVALGGVLLVNLLSDFRVPLASHILRMDDPLGWGGVPLLSLVRVFIEFKAFTLFSFLFGVGVAIQIQRANGDGRSPFLLRRFGALLAFGLFHMLVIWNGDILALYAVCGLLLLPLLRLPTIAIGLLSLALIAAPYVMQMPVAFPQDSTLRNLSAGALQAYRTAGWTQLFVFRWYETKLLILPLLLLSLPRTLGLMLLGVASWRRGFLQGHQRLWRWVILLGIVIGVAGLELHIEELATISIAFVYAAILLLWNLRLPAVAAAGQMALTNYLLQSIILGFVFYGYGYGMLRSVGVLAAFSGGVALYCTQLAWSRWWLSRFYFGPFEWLWRSVSYLCPQPFLREEARTVSREQLRVLLVITFAIAIPLIHLGFPWLLAQWGTRWGWSGGRPGPINFLGLIIILAGACLLVWILRTMLQLIRSLPPQIRIGSRPTHLVQNGPYAWVRHPMYVAELCFWAGIIVLLGSAVAGVVFVAASGAALLWVVRREDAALEKQFGDEYRSYRTRVPALPWFRRL